MENTIDLFEQCCSWQGAQIIKAAGVYPYFNALSSSDGPIVTVNGKQVVMLGSNNYLGLTHHPAVLHAAHQAIDRFGTSCTGSRFLNGNLVLHETLENELADFVGKEAAMVFSSGCLANFGVLGHLASLPGAAVFSQRENHGSIIDGLRLSHSKIRVFDDSEHLEEQLKQANSWPNALVVTDAITSMTGRVIDIAKLVQLKRKYRFRLYVDDAHGFGVLGRNGRGTCDSQAVTSEVDLIFATFSKAMASFGGFVAGDRNIIEYLRHHARTMIFSAALPPASVAAALAALRVMKEDQTLFDRLWENIHFFRQEISRIGYCIMSGKEDSPPTAIVPLFVGSESLAFRLCREALDMGVFATPAVYPAVPYGQSVIRTSLTPTHTRQHLLQALEVFAKLIQKYPQARVDIQNLPQSQEIDYTYLFYEP